MICEHVYPDLHARTKSFSGIRRLAVIFLIIISSLIILVTLPFSLFLCIKIVHSYERAVTLRLGTLIEDDSHRGGVIFIIPCIDTYCKVDLRTISFNVPAQEILTKDLVTVKADAVVYYRIINSTASILNVEDVRRATKRLAAIALRNIVATKTLTEIVSERIFISHKIQYSLEEATIPWGVDIERVELKEVRLPDALQKNMATEAETTRMARAKLIKASGEKNASHFIRDAANTMNACSSAMQLKYLQVLKQISGNSEDIIVLPLPTELGEIISGMREACKDWKFPTSDDDGTV
ncbi:stomatin-4-like [Brevipalpus obovatus]|uniref:stomatin-4-like n=1 Tax=Brevipalpus obovatus TaxID=246614 RepID=UPI003D9F9569